MSKRSIDQFPIALGAGPKTQQGPRAVAGQQDRRLPGLREAGMRLVTGAFLPLQERSALPLAHTSLDLPLPLLTSRAAVSSGASGPAAFPGFSCRCRTPSRPGCQWRRWAPAPRPAHSSCSSSRLSPQNTSLVPPPAQTPSCNKLWLASNMFVAVSNLLRTHYLQTPVCESICFPVQKPN